MKTFARFASLLLVSLLLAGALAGCSSSVKPEKAIIGTWVCVDDDEDTMTISVGAIRFDYEGLMASYLIDDENSIEFAVGALYGDALEWNEEETKDGQEGYWFISGNTLYWDGDTFMKK